MIIKMNTIMKEKSLFLKIDNYLYAYYLLYKNWMLLVSKYIVL